MRKIRNRFSQPTEEGFELVGMMVTLTIMTILAMAAAPLLLANASIRAQQPVDEDVRNAVSQAATYFTNYPASPAILTATPACEGGARNITGLIVTVSSNQTCVSVWGSPSSPTGFFVRGTHPSLKGEIVYSSQEQKYIRTGAFTAGRNTTPTEGEHQ